jgi:YebC/PmpR family DNA-binding regulatory protein
MAGHSKWANIKHRKSTVDSRRGKLFTKLSREIIVAARLGGPDVDSNARLRLAVRNAKSLSMPSENIKRAIDKGSGDIEGQQIEDVLFEGYGPSGVAIIVVGATDNRVRTIKDVRAAFSKFGGNLGETNSVSWNFTQRGELILTTDQTIETLLETCMEVGAEDISLIDDGALVYCSYDNLGSCENGFTERGLVVRESKFVYQPNMNVSVADIEQARLLMKLLDVLEDHDDVQNVFNNAEIEDDVLDQIQ